eukprot:Awhi_evm1s13980
MGIFLSALRDYFPSGRPLNVLMLGLDAAGKTTILYKLKFDEVVQTLPTIGFNVEEVQSGNVTFSVWDIGGQNKIRRLWHHYYRSAEGLVYIVDSNDEDRIQESRTELMEALSADALRNIPVLIFANKQDMPYAKSVDEIHQAFGLDKVRNPIHIQSCTAISGEGIHEGLSWLGKTLKDLERTKH